eukprot:TRINITY_DN9402_c0_g1_i1.p1 TRINITY_DN9402_c0_g1~~TRINITY_DN9402_c0_g1_i1.p1  ORF type:complete len:883 (-),score=180.32 TRINITY_DN9402_c0_g1_i1:15-2663(-)
MACVVAFVALLLVVLGAAGDASSATGLRAFLGLLEVALPDQRFSVAAAVTVTLRDTRCANITLDKPIVSYTDTGKTTALMYVALMGVSMRCTAKFGYSVLLGPSGEGDLVADLSSAELNATFEARPAFVELRSCAAHCSATLAARGLDSSSFVGSHVVKALREAAADKAADAVCYGLKQATRQVAELLRDVASPEATAVAPAPAGAMDLRQITVINAAAYVADDLLGSEGWNALANALSNGTGSFTVPFAPVAARIVVPSLGALTVNFDRVVLAGLNTWRMVDLFETLSAHELISRAALNRVEVSVPFLINFTAAPASRPGTEPWLGDHGALRLSAAAANASVAMQLALRNGSALAYTDAQCTDLGCLLALVLPDATAVTSISLTATSVVTSARLDGASLEPDAAVFANNALALIAAAAPSDPSALIKRWANSAIRGISSVSCADLRDMPSLCSRVDWSFAAAATAVAVVLTAAAWIAVATGWPASSCLLLDPAAPLALRLTIPLLLTTSAALYAVSMYAHDVELRISVDAGERTVSLTPLCYDNHKMRVSGAPLVSLLVVFSMAIWPCTRLVMLCAALVTGTSVPSQRLRGRLLVALSLTGSWQLMSTFVELLLVAAINFHFSVPVHDEADVQQAAVHVHVAPLPGMMLFSASAVAGILASLAMTWADRAACGPPPRGDYEKLASAPPVADFEAEAIQPQELQTERRRFAVDVRWALALAACVVGALFVRCVRFEVRGPGGWILSRLSTARAEYTALSITGAWRPAEAVLYACVVVALPLLGAALLSALHSRERRVVRAAAELACSYGAAAAFAVAVSLETAELRAQVQAVVGVQCERVFGALQQSCFDVVGSLLPGAYLLLLSAVSLTCFSFYTLVVVLK